MLGERGNDSQDRAEEEIYVQARAVNKEQENNSHRRGVMSLSTLDVNTPLVLYIAKFVFGF